MVIIIISLYSQTSNFVLRILVDLDELQTANHTAVIAECVLLALDGLELARVSKGWFKVVAAEYLNYDKYNDDEDAWYYADVSGNLYAGEFKTIRPSSRNAYF